MLGDSHVSPDDNTLVVFGIHHFGVGDARDGKEVPREGGVEVGDVVPPCMGTGTLISSQASLHHSSIL